MTYLLIAMLAVLIIGLGLVVAILYDIREYQIQEESRGDAALLHYLRSIFGGPFDGDGARLMSDISEFHKDIKRGRYPYLRRDDWYAKKADFARWEQTTMNATYCDD